MTESTHLQAAINVSTRPVIVGETIVDQFADGKKVLGGAPFNVAWNLRGLGFDPFFVSALGRDDEGALFRRRMDDWGMDRSGLQWLEDKSTGKVLISIEDGEPSYKFAADQAYDNLRPIDQADIEDWGGLLYHGSLVFRSERSRTTLLHVIRSTKLPRFVDVNIRQPHFDLDWVPDLVGDATWVKLNIHELAYLSGAEVSGRDDIAAAVQRMCERFGHATYFITSGSRGAYVVSEDQIEFAEAPTTPRFVDSVGAGDAFSSVILGGILRSDPMPETLRRAVGFAARVCGIEGATSDVRSLYQEVYQ